MEVLYLLDAAAHLGRWQCCCRVGFPSAGRCRGSRTERIHMNENEPANLAHMSANTRSTETTPLLPGHLQNMRWREKINLEIPDTDTNQRL